MRLLCAALAVASCRSEAVPGDLLGVWKTNAPRHANNFVEIRSDAVILGVVGKDLDVLEIEKLERTRDADGNDVFLFHYTADEGYRDVLAVTHLRDPNGLRVGTGEGVWYPADRR